MNSYNNSQMYAIEKSKSDLDYMLSRFRRRDNQIVRKYNKNEPLILQNQKDVAENSYLVSNGSVVRTDGKVTQNGNLDLYLDKHKLHLLLPKIDRIWEFLFRNNLQSLISDTTSTDLLIKPLQNISFTLNQLVIPDIARLFDAYPKDPKIVETFTQLYVYMTDFFTNNILFDLLLQNSVITINALQASRTAVMNSNEFCKLFQDDIRGQ